MNVVICSLYTVHALYLSLSISEFMYAMDWYGVILKHDQCREAEISSRAVPKQHTRLPFPYRLSPPDRFHHVVGHVFGKPIVKFTPSAGKICYKYKG